jgi:hypothetical protein
MYLRVVGFVYNDVLKVRCVVLPGLRYYLVICMEGMIILMKIE